MDDKTITALARECAEDATKTMTSDPNLTDSDISGIKRDVSEWIEEILRILLRRYALVGKSKVRQWIGVNERLPEIRKRVLICHRTSDGYRVAIGKRVPSPHPDGWEWNSCTKEEVITWMPLPDSPEIAKEVEE